MPDFYLPCFFKKQVVLAGDKGEAEDIRLEIPQQRLLPRSIVKRCNLGSMAPLHEGCGKACNTQRLGQVIKREKENFHVYSGCA